MKEKLKEKKITDLQAPLQTYNPFTSFYEYHATLKFPEWELSETQCHQCIKLKTAK